MHEANTDKRAGRASVSGPLDGHRVIELAGIGPVPFCAMLLSDLGADVVRIDRPGPQPADASRAPSGLAAMTEGMLGRGRRSITLDLKCPAGVATALELVAAADALVEGFRPGVMERLGLGPDVCHERNPRLVYGRLTGWGQDGPYARVAGHDLDYIALAGALAPLGRRGLPPAPPLNLIGDFGGGGMLMATGLLAALLEATRSGRGQVVDAAMVDGAAYQMTMMYEMLGRGAWVEERESNPNDGGSHFYDVYETADGEHVAVAAMEPQFYAELLARLGLSADALPDQWDAQGWPEASRRLAELFRCRTRDEWCQVLEGTDACFAPVLRMSEAPSHPHHVAREAFVTVDGTVQPAPAPRFSRTPAAARPASRAGEHSEEILAEIGLGGERIAQLRAAGALG